MASKVKLPKELRGTKFDRLLLIELNRFDIDGFLPAFFFTVLAGGNGVTKQLNDTTQIAMYMHELRGRLRYENVAETEQERLVEKLVRATLITTNHAGRGATKGEKISTLLPYTILTHKTGIPEPSSYLRNTDKFLYSILKDEYGNNQKALIDSIKLFFGKGVTIGAFPDLGGHYLEGQTVDILTRLEIMFLDGFKAVRARVNQAEKSHMPACPTLAHELARDIFLFMNTYYQMMPTQAFTYSLQALINFELFVYTLKLIHATNDLVADATKIPLAFTVGEGATPPWLYLDFTQNAQGASRDMAQQCVRRDIETYQRFIYSNLYLRQLDSYVTQLRRDPRRKGQVETILEGATKGHEYILGLMRLVNDDALEVIVEAKAQIEIDSIHRFIRDPDVNDESDGESQTQWLDDIASGGKTSFEQVIEYLNEAQHDNASGHYIQWYHQTGGLRKPYGILSGELKSRLSWRYEPSNDLLAVLVQVVAARLHAQHAEKDFGQPIRLIDFLQFLRDHYGILIDQPPEIFVGAEYVAAAQENMRALQSRLRQMGIFRGMSDDFTAQYLYPPFAK